MVIRFIDPVEFFSLGGVISAFFSTNGELFSQSIPATIALFAIWELYENM